MKPNILNIILALAILAACNACTAEEDHNDTNETAWATVAASLATPNQGHPYQGHPQEVPLHAASPVGAPLVGALDMGALDMGALDMDAATRAEGSTPITSFLPTDTITLHHHHGNIPVRTTMKLDADGSTWLTDHPHSPANAIPINILGETTIIATHTPDDGDKIYPAGDTRYTTYVDKLRAEASRTDGITPAADGNTYHVELRFRHTRTLIHIYKVQHANGNGFQLEPDSDVELRITDAAQVARKLTAKATVGSGDGDSRPRASFIIPHDATITEITFTLGDGTPHTAYPNQPGSNPAEPFEPGTAYAPLIKVGERTATFTIPVGNDIEQWVDHEPESSYTHTIATADDLMNFATEYNEKMTYAQRRNVKAIQTADIDLAGKQWIPIGNGNPAFVGLYNGNGYKIRNLHISGNAYQNNGLFGALGTRARVVNVYLEGVDINAGSIGSTYIYTGALAGRAQGAYIARCTAAHGTVQGQRYTGGLVGYLFDTHLTRSAAACRVSAGGEGACAGGLAGTAAGTTTILACMAGGDVQNTGTGFRYAGGLVAYTGSNTTIAYCYATGRASGGSFTGGLVGYNNGPIYSSYTTAGKLVGYNDAPTATNCWDEATGTPPAQIYQAVTAYPNPVPAYTWTGTGFEMRNFKADKVWQTPLGNSPGIDMEYAGQ